MTGASPGGVSRSGGARRPLRVVGISAFYHESACCLLEGGRVTAAAAEERFSRVKHDPRLPVRAFRFCLEAAGAGIAELGGGTPAAPGPGPTVGPDAGPPAGQATPPAPPRDPGLLDAVAYYESPVLKLSRQLWAGVPEDDPGDLPWLDPSQPERAIRERLGWDGPLHVYEHHRSHAASAFYFSGFPEAAVLTVDGVGEWATTTYGRGRGAELELLEEVRFPHSLGLFYSALTAYLGFRVNGGEYKVMGLAPYGRPRYAERLRRVLRSGPGGSFTLDMECFEFLRGRRMYSEALCDLLGGPPRPPGDEIGPRHADVARSAQEVLEEVLLEKVRYLHERVGGENLCMAGGVALNCVANGRILREGPFRRLFVQPAAGDAGGALGAAALAWRELAGPDGPPVEPLRHVYLGPRWSGDEVAELVAATGLAAEDHRGRHEALVEAVARRLAEGQVVGWFHGAMEMGPRALGARSILASPLGEGVRERLNRRIKRREGFRPFAPAVLAERAAEHFDLDHPSPYMLETCDVTSPLALPAVTHVDGSARPQTVDPAVAPRFAALLTAFERRTGCPVLLNTSFNVAGEPIVLSPVDALCCAADAGLDALVLEDFLLDRSALPEDWPIVLGPWRAVAASPFGRRTSPLREGLYTFV